MSEQTFRAAETTAWCPGCGNFDILNTLVGVLNDSGLAPKDVLLVGGIGQAAKLNQYVNANGFSGLHGRALPAAAAARAVNAALTVIVDTGDGDSYGEGGNHFLHNIRRNVNITHFVHDNQVYGLTKGQVSPTSNSCAVQPNSACNLSIPLNPLAVAIAAGAGFVARSFSGDKEHLAAMMKAAIAFEGYALLDILQPCVSFNKVNNFAYYKERVYHLEEAYDPTDKAAALARAEEFGDRIPIGILYHQPHPTFHAMRSDVYGDGTIPLIDIPQQPELLPELIATFT